MLLAIDLQPDYLCLNHFYKIYGGRRFIGLSEHDLLLQPSTSDPSVSVDLPPTRAFPLPPKISTFQLTLVHCLLFHNVIKILSCPLHSLGIRISNTEQLMMVTNGASLGETRMRCMLALRQEARCLAGLTGQLRGPCGNPCWDTN